MLEGLTALEPVEFHMLDATTPCGGLHVWPTGEMPHFAGEERGLALWREHQAALSGTMSWENEAAAFGYPRERVC
jgi:hypothetical protein